MYDAVILAVGAFRDRPWNTAASATSGPVVVPASHFVSWYNERRLPDSVGVPAVFDQSDAVVIGAGNVALDVCRILLKSPDRLAPTDISMTALDALRRNRVRRVHLVARRGLLDAAYTNRVLRDLLQEVGHGQIAVHCSPSERAWLQGSESPPDPLSRTQKRQLKLWQTQQPAGGHFDLKAPDTFGRLNFWFWRSATLDNGDRPGRRCVVLEPSKVPSPGRSAEVSCAPARICDVSMVIPCIGFVAERLEGLSLDAATGVARTDGNGRVLDSAGGVETGLYATGWIKRGPSGIIGTNRGDAQETVDSLIQDLPETPSQRTGDLEDWLVKHGRSQPVTKEHWRRHNEYELEQGKLLGKVRVKYSHID